MTRGTGRAALAAGWLAPLLGCLLVVGGACQQDTAASGGQGGPSGSGGATGTGGAGASGGATGTGGAGASGGNSGAGGRSASGGSSAATGGSSTTGGAGGATGPGGGAAQPASFATAREIVMATCGGSDCHQPGGTPPALLTDDTKLHATLLAFVSRKCGDRVLVEPGAPDESAFYLVQAGKCPDPDFKMPLGCVDRCTPPDYLEGVRQWIVDGAQK